MEANFSVRYKLLAGFSVIIVLMILVILLALAKIHVIQDRLAEVSSDHYPKVMLTEGIVKQTLDNGLSMRSVLLAPSAQEKSEWVARVNANRARIKDLIGQLAPLVASDKGRTLLAQAQSAQDAVEASYPQMLQLAMSTQTPEQQAAAKRYLEQSYVPANAALLQVMQGMAQHEIDGMDQAKADARHAVKVAYIQLSCLLLVSVLLALFMAARLSARIVGPLREAVDLITEIEQGNLASSAVMPAESRDEVQEMTRHLLQMRARLSQLILHIHQSALNVSDSAHELSGMAQQVAASSEQQAVAVSSAAATIEQLTSSINMVADNSSAVEERADHAGEHARKGEEEAAQSASQIKVVSAHVSETAGRMTVLSENVMQIGSIVTVIKEVADQTNLLALNAAIEAARAGEFGRGFAVVADEVRLLAERTASSAQEITKMIGSIQNDMGKTVDNMNENLENVRLVSERAEQAAETMHGIGANSLEVMSSISDINGLLKQQRGASTDLSSRMEEMAQVSSSNSATVEELASTSQQLSALSKDLQGLTSRFRLA
jgi:methyl-accepting chemotaxis protein